MLKQSRTGERSEQAWICDMIRLSTTEREGESWSMCMSSKAQKRKGRGRDWFTEAGDRRWDRRRRGYPLLLWCSKFR